MEVTKRKLFLDGIFEGGNNYPGSVIITVPNPSEKIGSSLELAGLMVGDPTWGAANTWGTIINDISNLTDISSLIGSESMFSWISASTMCWKGTAPLNIGIDFYLINYKKSGLNLEEKLRTFVKLASLHKDPDATVGSDFKVLAHGGYAADIFKGNSKLFDNVKDIQGLKSSAASTLNKNVKEMYNNTSYAQGSVQLQFGHKSKISNLLLSKVNVTESTVEVADASGGNIKPLYYRVSAQFTGVKPLLTVDVDQMFVGGSSGAAGGFWAPSDGGPSAVPGAFIPTGYKD